MNDAIHMPSSATLAKAHEKPTIPGSHPKERASAMRVNVLRGSESRAGLRSLLRSSCKLLNTFIRLSSQQISTSQCSSVWVSLESSCLFGSARCLYRLSALPPIPSVSSREHTS